MAQPTPTPTAHLATGFVPHDPDALQRYRAAGVVDDAPLWGLLEDAATRTPHAPAVSDPDRSLTYAVLAKAARRRAAGFLGAGLTPGAPVILHQNNSAAFAVNLLGLLRAGLAPVMSLPAHRVTELAHLAETAGAVAYVGDAPAIASALSDRVPAVAAVFVEGGGSHPAPPDADPASLPSHDGTGAVDPQLPALFLVSGGTTGLPKLIARTHADYRYNARRSAEIAELIARDVYLVALPGAHNFPLCCPGLFGALTVGAHTVFTDNPSPDNTFDIIERHGVTVTALVPALAQVWCAATEWEPADLSSLRLLQVGGAKLAHPDAVAIDAALGDVVQQVFGMAEGLICYTRLTDPRALVHESQGAPMSELDEVRVVDPDGHDVADGVEGELLTRGPYTIRGYYRAEEHNARSFTADGFYRSGDRVRRLPSGHLAVTGRIKDTIVRAGENVAADDIEEHLLAHPAVAQAAVVGLPDDALGERICAVLVISAAVAPSAAPSLGEVRGFLAERGLATFKLPDTVCSRSSLPVTAVGKIDKAALRRALDGYALDGDQPADLPSVQ
ncbi:(2,3-dihydroxybenzoyl)adenylate synthase [Williamsia herbipolensis]|uniref:(2,3-dihydroxybenzoyl)adenylate synthase n=1 Tax=Williamsia herbipolensis TaxID=1603258 RepID=UPI0005F7C2CD|nr:AMP-binding protein [Williamsia herbipolensis]